MVPPDARMLLIQISNLSTLRFGILFEKLIYYLFGCIGCSLFCAAFSSYSKWGLCFIAVSGLLIVVASLVAEHRL